jgi:hypothetical protein
MCFEENINHLWISQDLNPSLLTLTLNLGFFPITLDYLHVNHNKNTGYYKIWTLKELRKEENN